ncbi:hypothetical protein BC834DRAFT_626581 [Gloeopeniophorella convolvens]|nr:hypothetical protein BC834DRAFT_626581 [Gloeopeniophorella convolvens]
MVPSLPSATMLVNHLLTCRVHIPKPLGNTQSQRGSIAPTWAGLIRGSSVLPKSSQGAAREFRQRVSRRLVAPTPQPENDPSADSDEETPPREFPDLPLVYITKNDLPSVPDARPVLEPLEPAKESTLSAPPHWRLRIRTMPRDPPVTVGYGAFSARYEELVRAQILSGDGIWPHDGRIHWEGAPGGSARGPRI